VLYPNGDEVTYDADFHAGFLALFAPPDPEGLGSSDVGKRYNAAANRLDDGGLGPWARRWRDDIIAFVAWAII
jgi:hypothetical protein